MPLVLAIALGIIIAFIALPLLGPILMIAIAVGVIILLFYGVITGGVVIGTLFKGAADTVKDPEFQKKAEKTKDAAKDLAGKAAKNTKVRKAVIAIVAVIVVGVVGVHGYNSYSSMKWTAESVIDWVMGGASWKYGQNLDKEKREALEEDYAEVKNKGYFKRHLRAAIEEAAEVSLYNKNLSVTGTDGEKRESEYDFSAMGIVKNLNLLGYEDEAIKATLSDYWKQYGELMHQTAEDPLKQAQNLESFIKMLNEANETAGAFYQIDREEIYSTADVEAFYADAIDSYVRAKDEVSLVKMLHYATNSAAGGKASLEPKEIISLLTNPDDEIATLRKGIGGYYDGEGSENAYGDFYYKQGYSYKTKAKYDTSELNSGIWNTLSAGQKAEIKSGSSKTVRVPDVVAFRGEEINLDLSEVAGKGFHFVYCQPDGQFIFVSKKEIVVASSDKMKQDVGLDSLVINGDFSEIYAEMQEAYLKGKESEGKEAEELTEEEKEEMWKDQMAKYTETNGQTISDNTVAYAVD